MNDNSVPSGKEAGAAPVQEEKDAPSDDVKAQGQKYRKRPVVITAQQFLEGEPIPKGICFGGRCGIYDSGAPHVHTIHDNQRCDVVFGDWIIPEPDGEHYYPCKADIFWRTYERDLSPMATEPDGDSIKPESVSAPSVVLAHKEEEKCPWKYCGAKSYESFNRCNICGHEWTLEEKEASKASSIAVLQNEFDRVMALLKNLRLPHGACKPRHRMACTHCNSREELDRIIDAWPGAKLILSKHATKRSYGSGSPEPEYPSDGSE